MRRFARPMEHTDPQPNPPSKQPKSGTKKGGKGWMPPKHPGGRGGPQPGNDPLPNPPSNGGSKSPAASGASVGAKAGTSKPSSKPGSNSGKRPGGGKPGKGGKKGGGGGGASYKGLGKKPGLPWKQAQTIITKQTNQEIKKLLQDLKAEQRNTKFADQKINKNYNLAVGDLNHVFDAAAQRRDAYNQQMQQQFGQTNQQTNDLFNQFAQQINTDTDARRNAMISEMQRLGVQGVGTGQFNADAANAQNMMNANQAFTNQNLAAMQDNSNAASSLLGEMIQGSKAQHLGIAANSKQAALDESRQAFNQYMHDIMSQVRNVRSGKWSSINELAMALQEQKFNQALAWHQANFDNQMAVNNFNLDKSQFNAANMWKQAGMMQDEAYYADKYKQQKAAQQASDLTKKFADIIKGFNFLDR